ncbi:hypothetical protein CCR94_07540 [Rhodoblastus sphagnicola]|uniref:TIR domain-containing protein n=1 Tax=Rhodoblastus sphagnicola TaxID=333368 RepID=A0A2S6NBS5_9HYPH|nr:hypothetical protein [Rhodoblastus sphagnicola]MBB4199708.1 hypothetical protein [Rhodoblastus sphagnicola]PPQ32044.1 hypothetical protein CCR94_07540 [Rhodoblastus sphagnicola]
MSTKPSPAKRFDVALSFPGEHRPLVARVAKKLSSVFGRDQILYDNYYKAEFARIDLNVYLPNLYRKESELIVVFLCHEYKAKQWCRLEWRHIANLIASRDAERIMLFRHGDDGDYEELGVLAGDGTIDFSPLSAGKIANFIIDRFKSNRGAIPSPKAAPRSPRAARPTSGATPKTGGATKPPKKVAGPSPAEIEVIKKHFLSALSNGLPAIGELERRLELVSGAKELSERCSIIFDKLRVLTIKSALKIFARAHTDLSLLPRKESEVATRQLKAALRAFMPLVCPPEQIKKIRMQLAKRETVVVESFAQTVTGVETIEARLLPRPICYVSTSAAHKAANDERHPHGRYAFLLSLDRSPASLKHLPALLDDFIFKEVKLKGDASTTLDKKREQARERLQDDEETRDIRRYVIVNADANGRAAARPAGRSARWVKDYEKLFAEAISCAKRTYPQIVFYRLGQDAEAMIEDEPTLIYPVLDLLWEDEETPA